MSILFIIQIVAYCYAPTLILIFVADTRFGVVTGGGDVTNTRTDFVTIFGNEISNTVSTLFDCLMKIFCVAIYSRRNALC